MKTKKEHSLKITPVENYEKPPLPTLEETRDNPKILKELPSRWKRNKKIIACIGLAGALTLSTCIGLSNNDNNGVYFINPDREAQYREFDLLVRLHTGGGGSTSYVVHLTEQEALNIILTHLEAAGLNFGDTPPGYFVDFGGWISNPIGIDLFDEQNGVAISRLSWENSNIPFTGFERTFANNVSSIFESMTNNITVGVFYSPSHHFPTWTAQPDGNSVWTTPSAATARNARPILEANLNAQAQNFITFLQANGILDTKQINGRDIDV